MTREEIIEAIQHDNMMPFLQDWEARDIVDFVLKNIQPSLPEGVEEAEEEYTRSEYSSPCAFGGENIEEWVSRIFIAGAKWDRAKMMEKAVEADVNTYEDPATRESLAEFVVEMPTKNLGNKVKIIVIPEEK